MQMVMTVLASSHKQQGTTTCAHQHTTIWSSHLALAAGCGAGAGLGILAWLSNTVNALPASKLAALQLARFQHLPLLGLKVAQLHLGSLSHLACTHPKSTRARERFAKFSILLVFSSSNSLCQHTNYLNVSQSVGWSVWREVIPCTVLL